MNEDKQPPALVRNTASSQQVREGRKREKFEARRNREDLFFLLQHREGRRWLWHLLGRCGIYESSRRDLPHDVYFQEGRRDVGLKLLADVNDADEKALPLMMREAQEDEAREAAKPSSGQEED